MWISLILVLIRMNSRTQPTPSCWHFYLSISFASHSLFLSFTWPSFPYKCVLLLSIDTAEIIVHNYNISTVALLRVERKPIWYAPAAAAASERIKWVSNIGNSRSSNITLTRNIAMNRFQGINELIFSHCY